MNEPLVSVAMITYNHRPYIGQAIESVLGQKTEFPFELVIGEDCSTDGTREVIEEYQRKYPKVIRLITSEKNVGLKKNSYRALKACRGKYIAFCEGDDYWHHPLKLQQQADYLERHPESGMTHSSYDVYQVRSGKLIKDYIHYRKFRTPDNPDICEIVARGRSSFRIQTCTVMVRRDLYDAIVESDSYLHQSDHFLMGDTQVWAELSLASRIAFMPESLATYRLLDESASRSNDKSKALRFELSHIEMLLYLCDKHKLPKHVRRIPESMWCRYSLRKAFHERNGLLATEVREKQPVFTWKEWLFYLGARYEVVHGTFRLAALCRDRFVKERIN